MHYAWGMNAGITPAWPGVLAQVSDRLRDALRNPLPGFRAQSLMAPTPRPAPAAGLTPEKGRPAAALLLLYPWDPRAERPSRRAEAPLHVLLTVRSRNLPNHRGQISLPGGLVEPDESLREAALREAHEEVGLDLERVHVLGSLSAVFIPVTGFILHPFVATCWYKPAFTPSPDEVERVLEVPLTRFTEPSVLRTETRELLGREARVPYFDVEGERLWGATAMILSELLWLLDAPPRVPAAG